VAPAVGYPPGPLRAAGLSLARDAAQPGTSAALHMTAMLYRRASAATRSAAACCGTAIEVLGSVSESAPFDRSRA